MVNLLLTKSSKVNVLLAAESQWFDRGRTMKKQTRGFWTWLLGGGWSNAGSAG